jgi:TonB family protein
MHRPTQQHAWWLFSTSLHVGLLLLLLLLAATVAPLPLLPPHVITVPLRAPRLQPPRLRPLPSGGGQASTQPARKGVLPPKPTRRDFFPPMVATSQQPKRTVAIALADSDLENIGFIGDPSGQLGATGLGTGRHGGIGDGPGKGGVGDGPGTGYNGLVVSERSLTRKPQIIHKEEPEYSEPARRAKVQGFVRLRIEVGLDGRPVNIRVVQGIGLGLDENAIEAVRRWRFRPGLVGDQPVVAPALIEVGFHLL